MRLDTEQFGEITCSEDSVVTFGKGLIGFENHRKFLIINRKDYAPFYWMISINKQNLGFPLLKPFQVVPEFKKELSNNLVRRLFSTGDSVEIFCIATLRGKDKQVTINLKSPLIINFQNKTGEQIVLTSEDLQVDHPII